MVKRPDEDTKKLQTQLSSIIQILGIQKEAIKNLVLSVSQVGINTEAWQKETTDKIADIQAKVTKP